MKKIYFVTQNKNKIEEIRAKFSSKYELLGLKNLNFHGNIEETAPNIQGNALLKARFIHQKFGVNCFADDTGLEVEALGGRPGVHSARYAGEPTNSENNIKLLLNELKNIDNRSAQFRTVIALILDGKEYIFEGIAKGKIISQLRGDKGFGYDPIFLPLGEEKTFAQMELVVKNKISHRAKAINSMLKLLAKH